jgi:lipopolysaccharide transport system ATP-binding protein
MSNIVISVENLSKSYRLGQIGTGTLSNDLKVWWAKKRGLPNPMLKVNQIDYGNRDGETLWALKDINFTVERGEVLGIIGRNGAGKSTILKILSRVTAPTSGYAKVKGRIASLLEVGTGFHPDLTGRENIFLNGAILGMTREEVRRKFDEIVAFAEIEKFIDTPVKRYSSGMYIRLAFAVAAHLESEILLVDEVLAVGDAEFQKKCLGKMDSVAKAGRTVIFVSHNLGAVKYLCTIGLLMKKGHLFTSGYIGEIIGKYLEEFQNISLPLHERIDRQGLGHTKLTDIFINSGIGVKGEPILTGSPLIFKFYVTKVLSRMECMFNIYDDFGNAIANFNTNLRSDIDIEYPEKNNCYECYIEQLLLTPGNYRINVAINAEGILQDRVENAATFIIEPGGKVDNRPIPLHTSSRIHLPHRWAIPKQDS